jgi:hypothetical protein
MLFVRGSGGDPGRVSGAGVAGRMGAAGGGGAMHPGGVDGEDPVTM